MLEELTEERTREAKLTEELKLFADCDPDLLNDRSTSMLQRAVVDVFTGLATIYLLCCSRVLLVLPLLVLVYLLYCSWLDSSCCAESFYSYTCRCNCRGSCLFHVLAVPPRRSTWNCSLAPLQLFTLLLTSTRDHLGLFGTLRRSLLVIPSFALE